MAQRKMELPEELSSERLTTLALITALGLIVGALAALLFAPQTQRTRERIAETVDRGVHAGKEKAADLLERFPQIKNIVPHKSNGHSKHQIPD